MFAARCRRRRTITRFRFENEFLEDQDMKTAATSKQLAKLKTLAESAVKADRLAASLRPAQRLFTSNEHEQARRIASKAHAKLRSEALDHLGFEFAGEEVERLLEEARKNA